MVQAGWCDTSLLPFPKGCPNPVPGGLRLRVCAQRGLMEPLGPNDAPYRMGRGSYRCPGEPSMAGCTTGDPSWGWGHGRACMGVVTSLALVAALCERQKYSGQDTLPTMAVAR
jgi:hypothetical protein